MIISFDPVAGDVEIDLENGLPPLSVNVDALTVKFYGDGIITCTLSSAAPVVEFYPVEDESTVLALESRGKNRWEVKFFPSDASS